MKFRYPVSSSILILLSVCLVQAEGNKVGNGGDGVFCKGSNESAQILDFYEGNLKPNASEKDPYAIVEKKFTDLKSVAPKLGEQYLSRLKAIRSEIDFKAGVALTNIKDSNHLFKPAEAHCEVLQVVIRKRSPLPSEKTFIISQDLWDRLSPVQQAGMISHEIIYEHLMKLGATDSVKARAFNRFVFGEKYDSEKFWKFIQGLEIPIYP
ncbi:hypothetical protein DOM22_10840 [Bdellovibrio sp. ZAP7]|uniref:hypothetical protein n=1 Tax=Bdellovibrio sp. ZAP7 TaxID=2231053 RepID=UPI00115BBE26|nr:hypothetical protein [Bdellovibrio sp. ZAP7]QDK45607.1 hypothetical protein DOM22_10840 [Bdellovibrio sp. ZAP7]